MQKPMMTVCAVDITWARWLARDESSQSNLGGDFLNDRTRAIDKKGGEVRVLVACEFSGVVRDAFIRRGHNAVSCDLLDTESEGPHYKGDVLELLKVEKFDLMIAHPPCTYISNMSNCRIHEPGRKQKRIEGMEFFMKLVNAPIQKIAVENPRGLPEREYRKPDQIIQPYQFGHKASKATCLWLKGLPLLHPTQVVEPERKWDGKRYRTWVDTAKKHNSHFRSITFTGIANAMATQWGSL